MDAKKKFLMLNDVQAYKIAFELSNFIWDIVVRWEWFGKKHVGGQFVEAADSISANIAEGFGRYHKNDKIKFYRYSYGSLKESFDWNEKAKTRGLVTAHQYDHIFAELSKLPKEINALIKITQTKLSK